MRCSALIQTPTCRVKCSGTHTAVIGSSPLPRRCCLLVSPRTAGCRTTLGVLSLRLVATPSFTSLRRAHSGISGLKVSGAEDRIDIVHAPKCRWPRVGFPRFKSRPSWFSSATLRLRESRTLSGGGPPAALCPCSGAATLPYTTLSGQTQTTWI